MGDQLLVTFLDSGWRHAERELDEKRSQQPMDRPAMKGQDREASTSGIPNPRESWPNRADQSRERIS